MDAFLGEIRAFCFDYPPENWAFCNGAKLHVRQNTALVAIIGYTYGGDHREYFHLPDLQGRAAMGVSDAHLLGAATGESEIALTTAHTPPHDHLVATFIGSFPDSELSASPEGNYLGRYEIANVNKIALHYLPGTVTTETRLHPDSVAPAGSGAPHENRQPYLALNYCICTYGEFPRFDD